METLLQGYLSTASGATLQARLLVFACGAALCLWTGYRLSKRSVLVSIGSVLLTIGLALIAFSLSPGVFDGISYALGVKYPPLLYLVLAVVCLLLLTLHLAVRLSLVDARSRRLTQELALLREEVKASHPLPAEHAGAPSVVGRQ